MKHKEELVVRTLPLSNLKISECNVRKEHDEPEKINELAKSIQEQGILQPLLVRPENGKFGIIIGSRRYSAAKQIHLKEVPVTVRDLEDQESLIISLIENLQRNDLEPRETTQALSILCQSISQKDLARKLGTSQGYVQRMVTVDHLIFQLETEGIAVKMYPKEEERKRQRAIPLMHAVQVAEAFKSPQLKDVLEKEPAKAVEVAKAITNVTQENLHKILKEYRRHPQDNIQTIVEQAEMELLEDGESHGHAEDYRGSLGLDEFDAPDYKWRINYHTERLANALSNIHSMPEATDDVEVDFIRKSREHRKLLVSELGSHEASGMHSRLNYLNALIEEMLEEIEEQRKK